jgi:hypothetical protein
MGFILIAKEFATLPDEFGASIYGYIERGLTYKNGCNNILDKQNYWLCVLDCI